jgi:hypothetical protein
MIRTGVRELFLVKYEILTGAKHVGISAMSSRNMGTEPIPGKP